MLQLYSFFAYMISGIIIGILFDIFRILRKSFKTPDFITYVEDVLFWILTGFFLIFVLFIVSDGQIRIYNIISLLLGSTLYMISISKYFIKINTKIIITIKNIFIKLFKILLIPLIIIIKIFKKFITPFTFLVINIKKSTLNLSKKVKNNKKTFIKRRILKKNVE